MDTEKIKDILGEMENSVMYQDGLAAVPAYLLEQLHNVVFPHSHQHIYTENCEGEV